MPPFPSAASLTIPRPSCLPLAEESTYEGTGAPQVLGPAPVRPTYREKHLLQGCGENSLINWARLVWKITTPEGMLVVRGSAICEVAL